MKNNLLYKWQKIICFTILIASGIVIISSLCFFSSGWSVFQINGNGYAENFYSTYLSFYGKEVIGEQTCYSVVFTDAQNAKDFYVSLFQNIQSVNNCLFYLGLISIVLVAVIAITGSFSRKKYYTSNLVSGLLFSTYGIIMSIVAFIKSILLKSDLSKITADLENYYKGCEIKGKAYEVVNSSNCLIGIIVSAIFIVICGLFAAFSILRYLQSNKKNDVEVVA